MGDFEMDLIIGRGSNEAILTLTDRKIDFAIIQVLPEGRKAKPLVKELVKRLAYLKRRRTATLGYDRQRIGVHGF